MPNKYFIQEQVTMYSMYSVSPHEYLAAVYLQGAGAAHPAPEHAQQGRRRLGDRLGRRPSCQPRLGPSASRQPRLQPRPDHTGGDAAPHQLPRPLPRLHLGQGAGSSRARIAYRNRVFVEQVCCQPIYL